jgi:hemerythrin superfamily protein
MAEADTEEDDLLSELQKDHIAVEAVFERLESEPLTENERHDCLDVLGRLLSEHSQMEEKYLYPLVRKVLDDGDEVAACELRDHSTIHRSVKDLEAMGMGDARFDNHLKQLTFETRSHVQEEEGRLFPRLRKACDDKQLGRHADRVRQARHKVQSGS